MREQSNGWGRICFLGPSVDLWYNRDPLYDLDVLDRAMSGQIFIFCLYFLVVLPLVG